MSLSIIISRTSRFFAVSFLFFFFLWTPASWGSVIVFDTVTTAGNTVYLKVYTKKGFISQGGRRVSVHTDKTFLGTILTGGDGYGYLKYTPQGVGLKKIECKSGNYTGEGLLLVLEKTEKIILIEIEGTLIDSFLYYQIKKDASVAVNTLSKEFIIIYLSRLSRIFNIKEWLQTHEFPVSVILPQKGLNTLKYLHDKEVNIYAVIGSPALIKAAKDFSDHRLTFEKTKNGSFMKNWNDVLKFFKSSRPPA